MILTKAQKQLILDLEEGYFVWTNDGRNFKAWLGDEDSKTVKNVRTRTLEILLEKGFVKFINGQYRDGLYKYGLVSDYEFKLRSEGIKIG